MYVSPVEVRALGQFFNLKKVQEECVFFFREAFSRFTSDVCWKGDRHKQFSNQMLIYHTALTYYKGNAITQATGF